MEKQTNLYVICASLLTIGLFSVLPACGNDRGNFRRDLNGVSSITGLHNGLYGVAPKVCDLDYDLSFRQYFDEAYYLKNNADVKAQVDKGMTTAFDHFWCYGQYEGRRPSATFSEINYLNLNVDVKAAVSTGAVRSGFYHFADTGFQEKRKVNLDGAVPQTFPLPPVWQFNPTRNAVSPVTIDSGHGEVHLLKFSNTGSGRVEVHTASALNNYSKFLGSAATAIPSADAVKYRFSVDDCGNLHAIQTHQTPNKHVVVRSMLRSQGYSVVAQAFETEITELDARNFDFVGVTWSNVGVPFDTACDTAYRSTIYAIKRRDTSSGNVELYSIFNRGERFAHIFTSRISIADAPNFQFSPTFFEINSLKLRSTGTGKVELHIVRRDNIWDSKTSTSFAVQRPTAFEQNQVPASTYGITHKGEPYRIFPEPNQAGRFRIESESKSVSRLLPAF